MTGLELAALMVFAAVVSLTGFALLGLF